MKIVRSVNSKTTTFLIVAIMFFLAGILYFLSVPTISGFEEKPSLEYWHTRMAVDYLKPEPGLTTYRFWYLPSFQAQHVITVHEQTNGGVLTDKQCIQQEDNSFKLTQTSKSVSKEELSRLKHLLEVKHFWGMERHRWIKLEELSSDGTSYLMEVATEGNYKYVYRHEPDQHDGLLRIASFMFTLSGIQN